MSDLTPERRAELRERAHRHRHGVVILAALVAEYERRATSPARHAAARRAYHLAATDLARVLEGDDRG